VDDRRDGVEEGEGVGAGQAVNRLGQRRRGQGAGRDDDRVPILRRQPGDLAAVDLDQRLGLEACGDLGGKTHTVDRQGAAGGQAVGVAGRHDQRAQSAHLGVQQADSIVLGVIGAERVGADQLRQAVGHVGLGAARRAHLVQHHGHARAGDLPGRLATGQAAADHVDRVGDGLQGHSLEIASPGAAGKGGDRGCGECLSRRS